MAGQARAVGAGEADELGLGSLAIDEFVDAANGLGQELCEGRARAFCGVAEEAVGELADATLLT
eukprot:7021397-Alexandrium_andersonii.AAC.1